MRLITEIKVWTFLDKHSAKLLRKTDHYDEYFTDKYEVDVDYISKLSDNDLYTLEKELDNEKSYL